MCIVSQIIQPWQNLSDIIIRVDIRKGYCCFTLCFFSRQFNTTFLVTQFSIISRALSLWTLAYTYWVGLSMDFGLSLLGGPFGHACLDISNALQEAQKVLQLTKRRQGISIVIVIIRLITTKTKGSSLPNF